MVGARSFPLFPRVIEVSYDAGGHWCPICKRYSVKLMDCKCFCCGYEWEGEQIGDIPKKKRIKEVVRQNV